MSVGPAKTQISHIVGFVLSRLKSIYKWLRIQAQNIGVKYFSFTEKCNFDIYRGKFTIRYHL